MKMRVWRIANYETMQKKKNTRYPQQSDIVIVIVIARIGHSPWVFSGPMKMRLWRIANYAKME